MFVGYRLFPFTPITYGLSKFVERKRFERIAVIDIIKAYNSCYKIREK